MRHHLFAGLFGVLLLFFFCTWKSGHLSSHSFKIFLAWMPRLNYRGFLYYLNKSTPLLSILLPKCWFLLAISTRVFTSLIQPGPTFSLCYSQRCTMCFFLLGILGVQGFTRITWRQATLGLNWISHLLATSLWASNLNSHCLKFLIC